MQQFAQLDVVREEGLALVTIQRPQVLNALGEETLEELGRAFSWLAEQEEVRGVILTGAGEKAFSAGADVSGMLGKDPAQARALARRGQRLLEQVEHFPKPVLAAVNGFCLGGGCELALACHLRIASEKARFGQPEVKLGIIPGFGGTQRLARLVGRGRAMELLLSGEVIDAAEAYRIGLVNRVVAPDRLLQEARRLMAQIVENAPLALRYCLEAVTVGGEMPLNEALALEATLFGLAFATADSREGLEAFLQKRRAVFQGH